MRGGEGLGRAAEYAYFVEADTVYVPFYHESTLALPDRNIALSQHTGYPFGNRVEFIVTEAPKRVVTLALAVPSYLRPDSVQLPSHSDVSAHFVQGFLRVSGHFDAGDTVALNYGFEPRWVPLENRDIADKTLYKAMYGPLVLGYEADAPLELAGKEFPIVADGPDAFGLKVRSSGLRRCTICLTRPFRRSELPPDGDRENGYRDSLSRIEYRMKKI